MKPAIVITQYVWNNVLKLCFHYYRKHNALLERLYVRLLRLTVQLNFQVNQHSRKNAIEKSQRKGRINLLLFPVKKRLQDRKMLLFPLLYLTCVSNQLMLDKDLPVVFLLNGDGILFKACFYL